MFGHSYWGASYWGPDYWGPVDSSVTGLIKVWNGTTWVLKPIQYWNGSAWVTKPVKRWDGTSWRTLGTGSVTPPPPPPVTYGPKTNTAPVGATVLTTSDNVPAIVNAAPTGTTFYFTAGVYRQLQIAPKNSQVFIGQLGTVLSGAQLLTGWTPSSGLWFVGGQSQQGPVHPNAAFAAGTERPGFPETCFIDDVPLRPVDALNKVVPGTFFLDYSLDRIYIATDPSGHTIEAGKVTDVFRSTATNVTVQNFIIEKYDPQIQDGAIMALGTGWIIQDNEVRLNYATGLAARGNGHQIIGNYFHDNGQMGLGGGSFSFATIASGILVQGNEIANNGYWSFIDPLWEGGGFKFAFTDGITIRANYSHHNKGTGLWTDIDNINTLYEDNILIANTINGISHEISYACIIRNNTLYGNGFGDTRGWGWGAEIIIQNSRDVQVYGNRIDMTGSLGGIIMIQQTRGSGGFGSWNQTINNNIHNNIFVDRDSTGTVTGGFADSNIAGMISGNNTWTNNQYYMSDFNGRFQWNGNMTFAQFQTATGETGTISSTIPDISDWPP